jgi:hypothetical protein
MTSQDTLVVCLLVFLVCLEVKILPDHRAAPVTPLLVQRIYTFIVHTFQTYREKVIDLREILIVKN